MNINTYQLSGIKLEHSKKTKFQSIPNIMNYNLTEIKSTAEISSAFAEYFQSNSSSSNYEDNFILHKKEMKSKFTVE